MGQVLQPGASAWRFGRRRSEHGHRSAVRSTTRARKATSSAPMSAVKPSGRPSRRPAAPGATAPRSPCAPWPSTAIASACGRRTGQARWARSPCGPAAAAAEDHVDLALDQHAPAGRRHAVGLQGDDAGGQAEAGLRPARRRGGRGRSGCGRPAGRRPRRGSGPGPRSWRGRSPRAAGAASALALVGGVDAGHRGGAEVDDIAGGDLQAELGQQAVVVAQEIADCPRRKRRTAAGSSGLAPIRVPPCDPSIVASSLALQDGLTRLGPVRHELFKALVRLTGA